jgi:hypothetical protein
LHAVETTTDVLVPLSVNGYQHHPLVRQREKESTTSCAVVISLSFYLFL